MNTAQLEHALGSLITAKAMIVDQVDPKEMVGLVNTPANNPVLLGIKLGPAWSGKAEDVAAWHRFAAATRKYREAAVAFEKDLAKQG